MHYGERGPDLSLPAWKPGQSSQIRYRERTLGSGMAGHLAGRADKESQQLATQGQVSQVLFLRTGCRRVTYPAYQA